MHRLNRRSRRPLALCLVLCLTLGAVGGCASGRAEVPDPPRVEMLRLQITKVRNAIEETRATIANSRGAPYLPELYVRLAELLSEEARYHYQLAYEREQRASRVLHVPQVRLLKEKSIETYELVLERFPDSPLAPRVLFNIGHEHRELGNFDEMVKVLDRLVDNHEDHPLRYDALLVLGDYYFDQSKLARAKGYYDKIVRGPLYKVSGLGQYKLAWVWVNFGECDKALQNFERAIERSVEYNERARGDQGGPVNPSEVEGLPDEPNTTPVAGSQQDIDVRREALVDLTYCYSRKRKVKEALPYFRRYAYNRDTYVAALDRLASRYRTIDKFEGAVLTSRELLKLGASDDLRTDDARTLYASLKRLKRYDEIDADMDLISKVVLRSYSRVDMPASSREELLEEFEVYLRDLATSAQEKMGTIQKEAPKKSFAQRLARGYQIYFDTFPQTDRRAVMLLNMSDVLATAERDMEAGLRALEAGELIAEESERQGALYDAIVYFQSSLEREEARGKYERVAARASLRRAADWLLTFELEPDKERRVKFAVAQTYYDEGRFDLAIDKLTAVAYEFPGTDEADAALQLALDAYNTVNDNDGLMMASRRFLAEGSPASDQLKGRIKQVLVAAEQRKLDELSLQAAGEDGGDLSPLLDFADRQKGTDLGERALINAFVAARAIGDTTKMYELADKLAQTYPNSEQLPGIYTTLAQTAIARFEYDRAVRTLAKAAEVNPAQRVQLLVTSGELKEQLGDRDGAAKLYLEAANAAETPAARSRALANYAALLEQTSTAAELEAKLSPWADSGNPELLARLGLAQVAQGKGADAEMALTQVQGGGGASPQAQARANYGMAEVLKVTLENYPSPESVDLIQEFIAIVEVTQQSYLNAARQGSPQYTTASFSRLAQMLRDSARRLEQLTMPAELTPAQQKQVRAALEQRVTQLRATADQALAGCAKQLWSNGVLNDIVIQCAKGNPWDKTLVPFDKIKSRGSGAQPSEIDELRERLSKNPEDIEGLREVGVAFLDAGDPHAARLIFARAIQLGGGPLEQNLMGIASHAVGDRAAAFEAFSLAAQGGLGAAKKNLSTMLNEAGLSQMASEVDERYPPGTSPAGGC